MAKYKMTTEQQWKNKYWDSINSRHGCVCKCCGLIFSGDSPILDVVCLDCYKDALGEGVDEGSQKV